MATKRKVYKPTGRLRGRPSEYKPEYCEMVIEFLKQGMSIAEIGLELDAGISTIYQWREQYPDFAEALKEGRQFSRGWWERQGRINLHSKKDERFNSTLWMMNMTNRFSKHWKHRHQMQHGLDDGSTKKMREIAEEILNEEGIKEY